MHSNLIWAVALKLFYAILSSIVTTLFWKGYQKLRDGVDSMKLLATEHHEMYGWYQRQVKPNGSSLGSRGGHRHS